MTYKTSLPWRKFPRNTLDNPVLRFIINRMEKENRQAVFTLFLALYCEADDDGLVDISDAEFFADRCLMDVKTLELIVQHFEKRRLIERVSDDVAIYRIVDWLSPYPQVGGRKTSAERQREYRERKKEEAYAAPPTVSQPHEKRANAEKRTELSQKTEDQGLPFETEKSITDEQMSSDICALIKNGAQLTDDELIAQIRLYKNTIHNGTSRKEAQGAAEQPCMETDGVKPLERSENASSGDEERCAGDAKKNVTLPVTDCVTECNALHNVAVTLPPKIREEEERERERDRERQKDKDEEGEQEKDGEKESERIKNKCRKEKDRQKQKEKQESGNAVQEPVSGTDENAIQHREGEGDERVGETAGSEEKRGAVSWVTALWESVSRNEKDLSGLDEAQRRHCEAFLSEHFKRIVGTSYAINDQERASLRFLSIFLPPLADDQNSVEVVASQFIGVLNNFIKKGAFLGFEQCTARTLCSSYIFEPVFLKVEQILKAKTGGGMRWTQCLFSCLRHFKTAEYAVMSIDSG